MAETFEEGGSQVLENPQEVSDAVRWKDLHAEEEIERVLCPLCASDLADPIAREWGLGIVRCRACSAVYVSPRLRNPERSYWDDPGAKRAKYDTILRGAASHPRDRNYLEHLEMIRCAKPEGRFLDVGTHCGFFLRLARGQGWELQGVDPSASSARIAGEAFGLRVFPGVLHDAKFPADHFQVVTLVDVLEHVTNPRHVIQEANRILSSGGVVFIKVPNARYNLLKLRLLKQLLRQNQFDIFDSREHVVHYTRETLARLLTESGFRRLDFYVPRPIQAGAWWQRAARSVLYAVARAERALLGRIGAAATDIAVLAWK